MNIYELGLSEEERQELYEDIAELKKRADSAGKTIGQYILDTSQKRASDEEISRLQSQSGFDAAQPSKDIFPIDMLLFCPSCGMQHIDKVKPHQDWDNPPHRSHRCDECEHIWRPTDVQTNGVVFIKSEGKADQSAIPLQAELISIVRDLEDPNPCTLDHHGHCQEHGWFNDDDCPQKRAQRILKIIGAES